MAYERRNRERCHSRATSYDDEHSTERLPRLWVLDRSIVQHGRSICSIADSDGLPDHSNLLFSHGVEAGSDSDVYWHRYLGHYIHLGPPFCSLAHDMGILSRQWTSLLDIFCTCTSRPLNLS